MESAAGSPPGRCSTLLHGWMEPHLTELANGYERIAPEFLAGRGQPGSSGIGTAEVRAWARTLPAGASVLELGSGPGKMAGILIESGLQVHAIDAAPTLVSVFRQRFPGVPVACEAVEESTFFGQSFDAVLAWGLWFLLPVEAQRDLIRRVAAMLKPGGRLLFTSPPAPITWLDAMTSLESRSLGADVYRSSLAAAGMTVTAEYEDVGENHYYDAIRGTTAVA